MMTTDLNKLKIHHGTNLIFLSKNILFFIQYIKSKTEDVNATVDFNRLHLFLKIRAVLKKKQKI